MNTPTKCCSICGQHFPETIEFFTVVKKYNKFVAHCRACGRTASDRWKQNHPQSVKDYRKQYWQEKGSAINRERRQKRQNDADYRESINQYQRKYHQENKHKYVKTRKLWQSANIQHLRDNSRKYAHSHQVKRRFNESKRRQKTATMPVSFGEKEWQECLNWWNYLCAYCGEQQGLWNPLTADHLIPVSSPDCPGTIPTNIVPACRACNSSKHNKELKVWLIGNFGKIKAEMIIERIDKYHEWLGSL